MSVKVWVLPNREQSDSIICFDGAKSRPLRDVFPIEGRPKGFSHAIPGELLEVSEESSLYAYKVKMDDGNVCAFICANGAKDVSGRSSFIGILVIDTIVSMDSVDIPSEGLGPDDRRAAESLKKRLRSQSDPWSASVIEVLNERESNVPLTNVVLQRAVFPHFSKFVIENGIPVKKKPKSIPIILFLSIIIALVVLGLVYTRN